MKHVILLLLSLHMSTAFSVTKIKYPPTQKVNVIDTYFGIDVEDPYRWLENDTSKATANWVKSQNQVTNAFLDKIPFRMDLKKRLTELTNYPKYSSPFMNNGKYYFYKNNGLQNQSVLYEQESLTSQPTIVLDPNTLSSDGTVALSNASFSNDGKYLQYSIARSGSDWNEIFIMDVKTRQLLTDHIKWSKFNGISWHGNGFYYSAYDAPQAGKEYSNVNEFEKIFYHTIGQAQSEDKVIFENKLNPLRECGSMVTSDEKYLFLTETETTTGNSLKLKDLSAKDSKITDLVNGFENDYKIIDHYEGLIYVLTNWNAPKGRLMAFNPLQPFPENWKEILPENNNVLESVNIISGKIIAEYMVDVSNQVYAFDLNGKELYKVTLPTRGSVLSIYGSKKSKSAFIVFTSFTFAPTIYILDVENNTTTTFYKSEMKFKSEDYVSEQIFYPSKDGTKIPMSIIHKKGLKKNGNNPLLLYGYGGFNISLNPTFNTSRIPFLENGGIYVIANLRGGGEYGQAWHLAGTKTKKQNVFDDFIAAAEFLIANKYTNPKKIAINGGSNGGLLVGACMTQRPDLFAVAIPEVGVLDMLRYNLFTIGWSWATDYGTSLESKEMFEYLKAYSPLHNIMSEVNYPATMIMTGDHDDRVVPAHSFKFAATLQAKNNKKKPALLRIDTNSGHGAGKPIGKLLEAQTDMWSFVMYNLGMKPKF